MGEKVRIISDGTPMGTRVMLGDVRIPRVFGVDIAPMRAGGDTLATATIHLYVDHLDIIAEATIVEVAVPYDSPPPAS